VIRHAAEFTLLSVVGAEAATLCSQRSGEFVGWRPPGV